MPTWGGVTVICVEAASWVMSMLRSAASVLQRRVEGNTVHRHQPVLAGVVGGEQGVVNELDPGGDLAELVDQARHRLTDDRVTLRRAPATGGVAEGDERVVEGVAVGLELIGGSGFRWCRRN